MSFDHFDFSDSDFSPSNSEFKRDDSPVAPSEPDYSSDREVPFEDDEVPDTSCADRNAQYLPDTMKFFTEETKKKFHRMICSTKHKNKSRPSASKYDMLYKYAQEPRFQQILVLNLMQSIKPNTFTSCEV
jgi:hypothetical protein